MDFSFNSTMEEYYKKFIELQEKLRQSEEERMKLELKFKDIEQISKDEEKSHYRKLRAQYKLFLDEDRKRQDRNERIIRNLERIETKIAMLSAKTDRFNILRRQYQNYLQRVLHVQTNTQKPLKITGNVNPPEIQIDDNSEDVSSIQSSVRTFENPAVLGALEKQRNTEEKIEILDKYLQNLSSQRCRDLLESERKARQKIEDEHAKFDANQANSVADDIMNSIYNRYYSKDKINIPQTSEIKPKPQMINMSRESLSISENRSKMMDEKDSRILLVSQSNPINYEEFNNALSYVEKSKPNVTFTSTKQDDLVEENKNVIEQSDNCPGMEKTSPKHVVFEEEIKDDIKVIIQEAQPSASHKSFELTENEMIKEELQADVNSSHDIYQDSIHQSLENVDKEFIIEKAEKPVRPQLTKNVSISDLHQKVDNTELPEKQPTEDSEDTPQLFTDVPINTQNIVPENEIEIPGSETNLTNSSVVYDTHQQDLKYDSNRQSTILQDENEAVTLLNTNETDTLQDGNETVQYYQGSPQIQYDENGQPIQYDAYDQTGVQYDQYGQPILYDEKGQPIQPNYEQQYDEHRTPIQPNYEQQYDEHGQPIQTNYEQQYDEHGQPIQPKYEPQYDEHGQLIQPNYGPQYDEHGQIIPQYDEHGQLIPQYDANGQYIPQYDENGQLLVQYDEHGQLIPQYNENGQLIQQYDQYGQSYAGYGAEMYDENGQPIQPYNNNEETTHSTEEQIHQSPNVVEVNQNEPSMQEDSSIKIKDGQLEDHIVFSKSPDPDSIKSSENAKLNEMEQRISDDNIKDSKRALDSEVTLTNDKVSEKVNEQNHNPEVVKEDVKSSNVLKMLDTDSESVKQNTSKISNDSDFEFSNG